MRQKALHRTFRKTPPNGRKDTLIAAPSTARPCAPGSFRLEWEPVLSNIEQGTWVGDLRLSTEAIDRRTRPGAPLVLDAPVPVMPGPQRWRVYLAAGALFVFLTYCLGKAVGHTWERPLNQRSQRAIDPDPMEDALGRFRIQVS